MAATEGNRLRLRAMLGVYANTQALNTGSVASGRLAFDFDDVNLPQTAFKAVVRGDYDVAELAIVTYLQALAHGKPVLLLPTVVMAFPAHPCLAYNSANGVLRPSDLAGKRTGIRAHSVTTVTWVRGILQTITVLISTAFIGWRSKIRTCRNAWSRPTSHAHRPARH